MVSGEGVPAANGNGAHGFSAIRDQLDYSYHTRYIQSRQLVHDDLIRRCLQTTSTLWQMSPLTEPKTTS